MKPFGYWKSVSVVLVYSVFVVRCFWFSRKYFCCVWEQGSLWYELLLYCAKSMGDKRILQRELPFFLLLRWKYFLEERNESDYLAASQIVVAEDIPKERWGLLAKEYAEYPNNELSHIFADTTIDAPEIYYQERFEFFRRKRSIQIDRGIKKRCICRMMISFIAICSFCISVFWNLKSILAI